MDDRFPEVWARILEELGDASPPGKLEDYVRELVVWGERIHLTCRQRMAGAVAAQVSDSLVMLRLAGGGPRAADIGAGAGFPGMVWKLARPEWDLTMFERKQKLAEFLRRTAAVLGLEGVSVRAEEAAAHIEAGPFDVVTSKAAGRLGEILPIAAAMLRPGGLYVTAKGEGWEGELGARTGFSPAGRLELPGGRGEAISLRFDP